VYDIVLAQLHPGGRVPNQSSTAWPSGSATIAKAPRRFSISSDQRFQLTNDRR
jgi:hypothetical protein